MHSELLCHATSVLINQVDKHILYIKMSINPGLTNVSLQKAKETTGQGVHRTHKKCC